MRHMTATPERGPVVLIYGCSECNWIYRPQTPEEASEKYQKKQEKFQAEPSPFRVSLFIAQLAAHCF